MSDIPSSISAGHEPPMKEVHIHLQKSTAFRVIHADGAWFSLSPFSTGAAASARNIHFSFYNERATIPKKIVVKTDSEGRVKSQDLSAAENLKGFHRELEVDIVMSIPTALLFAAKLKEMAEKINNPTKKG